MMDVMIFMLADLLSDSGINRIGQSEPGPNAAQAMQQEWQGQLADPVADHQRDGEPPYMSNWCTVPTTIRMKQFVNKDRIWTCTECWATFEEWPTPDRDDLQTYHVRYTERYNDIWRRRDELHVPRLQRRVAHIAPSMIESSCCPSRSAFRALYLRMRAVAVALVFSRCYHELSGHRPMAAIFLLSVSAVEREWQRFEPK